MSRNPWQPLAVDMRWSWRVQLEGFEDSLMALAQCFRDDACRIEAEGEGSFMISSQLDIQPEPLDQPQGASPHRQPIEDGQVESAALTVKYLAEELLAIVNGTAALQFQPYEPVRLWTVFGRREDGRPYSLMHGGSQSSKGWREDLPKNSDRPGQWLHVALTDSIVAEGLEIFGRRAGSPRERSRDLYCVYEIVRDDLGGSRELDRRDWLSGSDLEDCRRSLNLLRHSRPTGAPPSRPMSVGESEKLLRLLVQCWIEEKERME